MIELLEQYDHIDGFHEGLAAVWTKGGVGFIDIYGEMAISPRYEKNASESGLYEVYRFSEGVSVYFENGKYGFIDKLGYTVISADYKKLLPINECVSAAKLNEKWGFINHRGRVFIPFIYDYAQNFHEGICWVKENEKYGCIDQSGQIIIPFSNKYHIVNPFHCNVSVFGTFDTEDNSYKYGVISKKGEKILDPIYSYVSDFNENLASTAQRTYIDTSGKTVLYLPQYEKLCKFSNGRALVRYDGKWGAIDISGELVIPTIYDECNNFNNNYAAVKKENKWGYIDKNGEVVLPIMYDYATNVNNDRAVVRLKNKWMIVKFK